VLEPQAIMELPGFSPAQDASPRSVVKGPRSSAQYECRDQGAHRFDHEEQRGNARQNERLGRNTQSVDDGVRERSSSDR
jgi:hypothetical protein